MNNPHLSDEETHSQNKVFEKIFSDPERWAFHDTTDVLTRYVRDRRMHICMKHLKRMLKTTFGELSILVICGGVGGEATYLRRIGFGTVVNSDFSENAILQSQQREPEIQAMILNAQEMHLPADSFDVVLVQDGLHHLPRPVSGLNEMLRIARRAVIVIEPHTGIVPKLIGQTWEKHGDTVNYVFRWNKRVFKQVVLSQLLKSWKNIVPIRIWDHSGKISGISRKLGCGMFDIWIAKFLYFLLTPLNFMGNSFLGIVIKK